MGIKGVFELLLRDIASLTYKDIVRRKLVMPFIVFITFLLSFAISRIVAYTFPAVNLIIWKYHIHHFYYGILLLTASSWIALISDRSRPRMFAALLMGTGLGIIADELGLLLTCTSPLLSECDYYARIAVDLFTTMAAVFFSVLYFLPLWRGLKKVTRRASRTLLFFLE